VLVDDGPEPGGGALLDSGRQRVGAVVQDLRAAGVEVLTPASALGYFDGMVPVWQGDTLHQVRARHHVFANGTIEQPLVFAGNDLPGVMLSGGVRRLLALYAVLPGSRAVVATTCDRGLAAAVALRGAGAQIAAVADARPTPGAPAQTLRDLGIEVLPGHTVLEARGRKTVSEAVLAPIGRRGAGGPIGQEADGVPIGNRGGERTVPCDLLVISGGAIPASSLLLQAGAQTSYDRTRGHFALTQTPMNVHSAGEVAGVEGLEAIAESGALAGLQAAHALGLGDAGSRRRAVQLQERPHRHAVVAVPAPVAGAGRGKCFACLCEDVTSDDIRFSIEEGYDSIELCKRYTTVTMGPCQGRMCQLPAIRVMAQHTGQSLDQVGTTTARPPWAAVPMGVLAGRPLQPAKRSSLHGRHRELGANVQWAGDWRRAYDYGDPQGEALSVHRAAGLIDVSTLGKLLVRGPDAGAFLDRLYPNRISNLEPGRIRYGVLSSDAGRILDDGTVCRLDAETFYVTTTSSGAGAVEEWFSWWLTDWDIQVHLTDVTQGLAALNLAGPRAREIMSKVSELDCSNEAFRYLDGKRAAIAGVQCLILRIGFVGEVGYELHFPAAYAEHVWDALLVAGKELGIRPFGLEPQRILRLQKLHVLVGQDTDSESTPFGAAMPWIVKLDKDEDFIGKWALEHYAEGEPATSLVGFRIAGDHVPTEGAVVIDARGAPAGQVTSARYSPVLERVIGMAWVPSALAADGMSVTISDERRMISAQVQTRPFYDPEGLVLRS
jgi:sarcosine oxidase, subunit alpha